MDTQADSGQTDGHTVIQTCRQIDKKRDRQVERQIFASEKKKNLSNLSPIATEKIICLRHLDKQAD